jgi:hypothetical protein
MIYVTKIILYHLFLYHLFFLDVLLYDKKLNLKKKINGPLAMILRQNRY